MSIGVIALYTIQKSVVVDSFRGLSRARLGNCPLTDGSCNVVDRVDRERVDSGGTAGHTPHASGETETSQSRVAMTFAQRMAHLPILGTVPLLLNHLKGFRQDAHS